MRWRLALPLAVLALYLPFILMGLIGFGKDAECRARWWRCMPVMPGLAPGYILLHAPRIQIAGVPLHKTQPAWLARAWDQVATTLVRSWGWAPLLLPAGLTASFLAALAALLHFADKSRRGVFISGLVFASLLTALTYAMFLA